MLQVLVNDVYRVSVGAVIIHAPDIDTRLPLLENLTANNLETLAGFIVFVRDFLARNNGGISTFPTYSEMAYP